MSRLAPLLVLLLAAPSATAAPLDASLPAAAGPAPLDLTWRGPASDLTPDERRELLSRPRFAAGEAMMVGGLVAVGAGIAMLVAGIAEDTPPLGAAGAATWATGAAISFTGVGLFVSETRPYFRAKKSEG